MRLQFAIIYLVPTQNFPKNGHLIPPDTHMSYVFMNDTFEIAIFLHEVLEINLVTHFWPMFSFYAP